MRSILTIIFAIALVACGGGGSSSSTQDGGNPAQGLVSPTLTPLIINNCACKSYGDPPFTPTLPTSNSPGKISYSSRSPDIASVDSITGLITIKRPGFVLIDAVQEASGIYSAGGTTSSISIGKGKPNIGSLEVTLRWGSAPVVINDPSSNSSGPFSYFSGYGGVIDGKVFTPLIAPRDVVLYITQGETDLFNSGTSQGTVRILSDLPPEYVARAGLTWAPLSAITYNFGEADSTCKGFSGLGRTGWRLPSVTELQDWDFSVAAHRDKLIWTSTPGSIPGFHFVGWLGLPRGNFGSASVSDAEKSYLLCVISPY